MRRSLLLSAPVCAGLFAASLLASSAALAVPVSHDPLVQLAAGTSPVGIAAASGGQYWVVGHVTNELLRFDGGATTPNLDLPTGSGPQSVASDSDGGVWTANSVGGTVTHYESGGTHGTSIGLAGGHPIAIAVDGSEAAFTVSPATHLVSKITYDAGTFTLSAVTNFADIGTDTSPVALAIDSAGNIYTANHESGTISKVTPAGIATVITTIDSGAAPDALVIDSHSFLYVANFGADTVTKINLAAPANANVVGTFTLPVGATPTSLAVDSLDNVYVVNAGTNSVSEIPHGTNTAPILVKQYAAGSALVAATVSSTNELLITSTLNNSISSIDLAPAITTTSVADGTVGTAYSATLAGTGVDPLTFTSDNLPAWLHLDGSTGELTGTPTEAGPVSFSLFLGSPAGPSAVMNFAFTVNAASTGGAGGGGGTGGSGTAGAGGAGGSAGSGSGSSSSNTGSGGATASTLAHTGATASSIVEGGAIAALVLAAGLGLATLRRRLARSSR